MFCTFCPPVRYNSFCFFRTRSALPLSLPSCSTSCTIDQLLEGRQNYRCPFADGLLLIDFHSFCVESARTLLSPLTFVRRRFSSLSRSKSIVGHVACRRRVYVSLNIGIMLTRCLPMALALTGTSWSSELFGRSVSTCTHSITNIALSGTWAGRGVVLRGSMQHPVFLWT